MRVSHNFEIKIKNTFLQSQRTISLNAHKVLNILLSIHSDEFAFLTTNLVYLTIDEYLVLHPESGNEYRDLKRVSEGLKKATIQFQNTDRHINIFESIEYSTKDRGLYGELNEEFIRQYNRII